MPGNGGNDLKPLMPFSSCFPFSIVYEYLLRPSLPPVSLLPLPISHPLCFLDPRHLLRRGQTLKALASLPVLVMERQVLYMGWKEVSLV